MTKSEEANQKLQREVKEVCWASLSLHGQDPEMSQHSGFQEYNATGICINIYYSKGG